jgi:CII-binding regulator of phage lambda lysogenization HflD
MGTPRSISITHTTTTTEETMNPLDKTLARHKKELKQEIQNLKAAMTTGANQMHDKDIASYGIRVSQLHRQVAAKQHALANLTNCHHIVEQHQAKQIEECPPFDEEDDDPFCSWAEIIGY